jgi:uncharacterized protein (TIGR00251 family)
MIISVLKISVKVIPGAKKSEIIDLGKDLNGRKCFKIKVNQPPEDGKANQAVIEMVARYFQVKKNEVTIISGFTSKNKILEIATEKS